MNVDRFFKAVESDDTAQATTMLAKNPALAKARRGDDGATPLHVARSVAMAKLLLDQGADVNARDRQHAATPLRWAAARMIHRDKATRDLIALLQSRGAVERDIYFAAAVGDVAGLRKLGADDPALINEASEESDVLYGGCAPLQIAAYMGQLDSAKTLLDLGADVHDQSGWNNTEPLEKAAWTGATDVVALLLEHGASVNGTDNNFTHSPLYNAAIMGHAQVVKLLLDHGAATSPGLPAAVRAAMKHPGHWGAGPGTPEEFRQVLSMLSAAAATTQPSTRPQQP